MFKRICITLVIALMSLGYIGVALAEPLNVPNLIEKIPNLKQGVAFSLLDNEISYLSTFDVFQWKKINLEAGYSSEDKVVAVISYPIVNLKEDFNVTLPLLDLINCRVGVYAGYGRIGVSAEQNEFDFGISATLLELKF